MNVDPSEKEFDRYDIILVGGGTSAMGFLYGLLEDGMVPSRRRIAILEQGVADPDVSTSKTTRSCGRKELLVDWYATAHKNDGASRLGEASIGNRRVKIPRGMGRGGTTRINAGLCCSWSKGADTHDGSLHDAMEHLQTVLKKNGVFHNEPVPLVVDTSNGSRVDYYQGLIQRLGPQEELTWIEGATCHRILYEKNQAKGVEYTRRGDNAFRKIYASRVVLTAGVFASPVILKASGLCEDQSIFLLQDHVMIPAAFFTWPRYSYSSEAKPCWNGVRDMHKIILNRDYTFQISEMDVSVFPSILPALTVDYIFRRTTWDGWKWFVHPVCVVTETLLGLIVNWTPLYWVLKHYVKVVAVFLVRSPTSFNGSFRIKEQDQQYFVSDVQLDYLRSDRDLEAVRQFWTKHLPCFRFGWEFFPGQCVRTNFRLAGTLHERRFRFYCHQFCLPYFHWCGSLASLTDSLPRGLFVCDASALHPLPPVPPALDLAARGYLLAKNIQQGIL